MLDQRNDSQWVSSILPQALINATVTGATVDTVGYFADAIIIAAGTITDGTHTPKIQHAPDAAGVPGAWADVPAAQLIGPALVAITTGLIQRVGYIGINRFLRVVSTVVAGATGGFYVGGVVLLKPGAAAVA